MPQINESLDTSEKEAGPCPTCWHTTSHYDQCPDGPTPSTPMPLTTDTSSLDTGEGEAT